MSNEQARTTRRGTLMAPKAGRAASLDGLAEEARKTMDELEEGMRRIWPTLEAIGAEMRRSLETLERAYGPRPR